MSADISPPVTTGGFGSSYNISLNLSSIFNLPSRLLARIRRVDDLLNQDSTPLPIPNLNDWTKTAAEMSATATPTLQGLTRRPPSSSHFQPFPGPWGFFTSGYAIGLFAMAILLHRIQNIVVPPRGPSPYHPSRNRNPLNPHTSQGHSLLRILYASMLPLDLTRTSTRLAFHLPSLYFIGKMLCMWFLILLQTSNLLSASPDVPDKWSWVKALAEWSSSADMQDVCWSTFCAVCGAFCVEALVRGLDGAGVGLTAHMNANTSPFNLVGYAFLLHIYSSPITHVHKVEGLPSRPDKHVVITITIPLLQLTIFHILSIRKRWSHHRLLPTALSSFLSLTHFHLTLLHHSSTRSLLPNDGGNSIPGPSPAQGQRPATYPLLNYIPNIFESLLLLTTLLTIALNALTQLLLTGRITRPLLGLGLTSGSGTTSSGTWSWNPPYDEDFGVLLLRVGTASLEATGLRGWGNEVGGVIAPAPDPTSPALPPAPAPREKKEYGSLQMTRAGVVWISNASTTTTTTSAGTRRGRASGSAKRQQAQTQIRTRIHQGWANEIRTINSAPASTGSTGSSWWHPNGSGAGGIGGDWRWYRELGRFGRGVWGVLKGLGVIVLGVLKKRVRERGAAVGGGALGDGVEGEGLGGEGEEEGGEGGEELDEDEEAEAVYERFLRGEDVSDDEDADAGEGWEGEGVVSSADEDDEDLDDGGDGGGGEAVGLYTDLAMAGAGVSVGINGLGATPVLLAHMTHEGGSPLTRRRYGELLGGGGDDMWEGSSGVSVGPSSPVSRGPGRPVDSQSDESRRNCVVCTVEPRQIICWPCRCLALCDDCRESMASRSSASKHRCPCCRRNVEGYSRIFIP